MVRNKKERSINKGESQKCKNVEDNIHDMKVRQKHKKQCMYVLHTNIKLCKTPRKTVKRKITKDAMSQGGRGRDEPLQCGIQGPAVLYLYPQDGQALWDVIYSFYS